MVLEAYTARGDSQMQRPPEDRELPSATPGARPESASRVELGRIRTSQDGVLALHATLRGGVWRDVAFGKNGASSFQAELLLDGSDRRKLNLLQAVSIDGGPWKLDHGDGATYAPFYTESTFGKLIRLGDTPSVPLRRVLQFVTAVVALDGEDAGRVLGLLRWQETVWRPWSKLFSARPEDTRAENQSHEDAFERPGAFEQLRSAVAADRHAVR
jgi:hypothetical protein